MATSDDLWGGQLVGVDFDAVTHGCDLRVTSTVNGETLMYVVACLGVSEFRFHNALPEPWNYAEVTEVHLEADRHAERQVLELMLWSEDAGIVIVCSSVEIYSTPIPRDV